MNLVKILDFSKAMKTKSFHVILVITVTTLSHVPRITAALYGKIRINLDNLYWSRPIVIIRTLFKLQK